MRLRGAPRMQVFPLRCPRCGEPMRVIAFVTDSGPITYILASPTSAGRLRRHRRATSSTDRLTGERALSLYIKYL